MPVPNDRDGKPARDSGNPRSSAAKPSYPRDRSARNTLPNAPFCLIRSRSPREIASLAATGVFEMDGTRTTAVYVGNNRILTKSNFLNLIYLIEADDRVLAPKFVMEGVIEADTTGFFLNNIRPDSHCIDVGANFGYYSCIMAKLAHSGKTVSVEPDPIVFELLRDNLSINWLSSDLVNGAVSDAEGTLTLYRRHTRSANTSISKPDAGHLQRLGESESTAFEIPAVTIDGIAKKLSGRVDFMKVDVEGAEPLVFAGAKRTIAENPQLQIVMEWSPYQLSDAGFPPAEFTRQLAALGLRAGVLLGSSTPRPVSWDEVAHLDLCNLHLQRNGG